MPVYKGRMVADVLREYGLIGEPFVQTAWGHVLKGEDLLVVNRVKEDDPLRGESRVIPGGRLERNETYLHGSQRETLEETGVKNKPGDLGRFRGFCDNTIVRPRENVTVAVQPDGRFWACYTDSGKRYTGWLFDLIGLTEPKQMEAESRYPQYKPFRQLMEEGFDGFTPACKVILEIAEKDWGKGVVRKGDVLLECDGLIPLLAERNQYDL